MTARLASLIVGGSADPWVACGFALDDDGRIAFANGAIVFTDAAADGILALVVDGVDRVPPDVDGVRIGPGTVPEGVDHPNHAFELDHVVMMTDSLERTTAAITSGLGLECRRVRETDTVRQGFHRFGDHGGVRGCILEVVESDQVDRAALWGLVINVSDLDAAIEQIGADRVGPPKLAVQPGRRIATVRTDAGLGVPIALMTPAR